MQLFYTKYCCFLCLWDSRDQKSHYIQDKWTSRNLKSGKRNAPNDPLVNPNGMILLQPQHIKLELMKSFVKSMNKNGEAFQYLRSKFPRLSDANIKKGFFLGAQIRKIMKNPAFDLILEGKEKITWKAFESVV
ncbi:uncharacterized protein TNCV_5075631 [Trichonephila clavipes]|uniref:Uncharacterized protein n=1 Tax=Trichonephila clavipes TaxID=2585209 RepID=A0A8X6RVQ8_TRICX|nr:uncharacterized protein TNCV_5075631 [Trichonephila clavipes]